jgi:hypothetical protein
LRNDAAPRAVQKTSPRDRRRCNSNARQPVKQAPRINHLSTTSLCRNSPSQRLPAAIMSLVLSGGSVQLIGYGLWLAIVSVFATVCM